jgi:uncharacterized protein YjdB
MGKGTLRGLGLAALAAMAGAIILIACRRDFDSPYMPGSPGYAGDDWTRDADGNGIADSLDKYSPGCKLPPKLCLENAKVISGISRVKNSLNARNITLWAGDGAQAPILEWTPSEAALRGYSMSSSDTTKVLIRDDRLLPVAVGSAQISVSVPGVDSLFTSFIAKVVSGGIRVESVSARDITMSSGRDTVAVVKWTPADADVKEYSLASDQPRIASIANGQSIHGESAGKANITLVTADGSRKTTFAVNVIDGPRSVYTSALTAETMFLVRGGGAEAPVLHWFPEDVTDKRYKLVPVDAGVVSVTADSQRVVPAKAGSTLVLAKALDGSGKATEFTVIVSGEAIEVTGIDAADMNLVQGADPAAPQLTWIPANATNRKYSLSSKDPGVAIVSSGLVMPISMGTSLFTVTTVDGGFTDSFTVTVGRPDTAIHVDSVEVAAFSMPMGSSRKPIPVWHPSDAGNQSFTLASDDTTVLRADGEILRALKVGSASVRLTTADGARTADFKVSVYGTEIPVTSIAAEAMSLTMGQEMPPVATWSPLDATNPAFTLISQDTAIVTIAGGARVFGKGVGTANVTIKAADGPTGVFQVIVNAVAVKLISMTAANFTMNVGDPPRDAILSFNPSGATNKAVTLKAPAGSPVISVNAQNKVAALAPGKALLSIVSNENAGITAVCSVTVVALVKSVSAKDDTLRVGQAEKDVSGLMTWDPPNATNKDFTLKSNDTTIVKPTGDKTYKAMAGGKTTVVVRASDGSGKADTFNVWVKIPLTQIIAQNVTLKTTDPLYNTDPLMTFVPATASDKTWWLAHVNATAGASVVAIQNGWQLKPVGPGTAAIIANSSDNPAVKDTFTVTITQPVTGITATAFTMKVGDPDREGIIAVQPANATDKSYTLTANTPSVATVAPGNKIHAVAGGSATFTAASVSDPSKSAQFVVTVNVAVISVIAADLTMKVGDPDREPAITWNPTGATNKNYSLTTSNAAVVSIVGGTKLHAAGGGSANVIVTPADGGKGDTLVATVTVPVVGITVADITLRKGEGDKEPVITWNPAAATNKGYVLSGGSPGIATVPPGGTKIHPAGSGSVNMTATTTDGGKTASFTVTVVVPVERIKGTDLSMWTGLSDESPTVEVSPPDATNKQYTLTSLDPDVATIVNGKIHAVDRGTARIVATSLDDEGITDTFEVTVVRFGF